MLSLLGWAMCWWLHNSRNEKGLRNSPSGGKTTAPLPPVPAHTNRYCANGQRFHPLEPSAPSSTRQQWLSRIYTLFYAKNLRITHRWSSVITEIRSTVDKSMCITEAVPDRGMVTKCWHDTGVLQTQKCHGVQFLGGSRETSVYSGTSSKFNILKYTHKSIFPVIWLHQW